MNDQDRLFEFVVNTHAAAISALGEQGVEFEALARVVRACVDVLPVDGAYISVMSSLDKQEKLYASDDAAVRIANMQFSLGEGPGFEAFVTGAPVLIPDLREAAALGRPVFAMAMGRLPVGAIFAFPLRVGATSIGAVELYRVRPGRLEDDELAVVQGISGCLTLMVLELRLGSEADGWRGTLASGRAQVHQATGMLIATFDCSAEQALARLRGHAFVMNRPVDDVAQDIVAGRLSPLELH